MLVCLGCSEEPRSYFPPGKVRPELPEQVALPEGVEKLRIGLVPYSDPESLKVAFARLGDYLTRQLRVPIELKMGDDYDAAGKMLEAGEVDLVLFSPYAYVRASRRVELRPLVTAISDGSLSAAGYIVVRADSPRKTIADLKGGSFGFVDPASTSGYLFPTKELLRAGVDPKRDFSSTEFLGNHQKVLLAVLEGTLDAGATYHGAMKALRERQGIDPLSFRVIGKTDRSPHDTLAMRADGDVRIGKAVTAALLRLTSKDTEGREILGPLDMNGFYLPDPSLYDHVKKVELELGTKGY